MSSKEVFTFIINKKKYEIDASFRHPGGEHIFPLHNGRDITMEFETYHLNSTMPQAYIDKLKGRDEPQAVSDKKPTPDWKSYRELKKEVNDYYTKHRQYFLTMTAIRCAVTALLWLVSFYYYATSSSLLMGFVFGFVNTYLAYIGHETIHFAFGNSNWGFHLMTFAGHDATAWFTNHNLEHHIFTNFSAIDQDIDQSPLIRHVPHQAWQPQHRYQHLYAYLLYGLAGLRYMFQPFAIKKKLHVAFFHVIAPAFFLSPGVILCHFCAFVVSTSFYLALVNVINHTNDLVEFDPDTTDFFAHQVRTTLNYGSESFIQNLLTSGLNNQIEHHLFPTLPSLVYPHIAPLVRDFARQKGLKYHEVDTFFNGLQSHHRHLVRMSVPNHSS
jgi:linoleoyl-CoA desaturase